jgi:hypothetical protein
MAAQGPACGHPHARLSPGQRGKAVPYACWHLPDGQAGLLGQPQAGADHHIGEQRVAAGPPSAEPLIGQPVSPVAAQPGIPPLPVLGRGQPLHLIPAGVAGLRRRDQRAAVTVPVPVRRSSPGTLRHRIGRHQLLPGCPREEAVHQRKFPVPCRGRHPRAAGSNRRQCKNAA